jgi:hypothetical protein
MTKVWDQEYGFCLSRKLCEWCKWRICNWYCVKENLTLYIQYNRNSAEYRFCYGLDTEQKFKIQSTDIQVSLSTAYLTLRFPSSKFLHFRLASSQASAECHCLGTFRDVMIYISPRNKLRSLTTHSFHCAYFFFLRRQTWSDQQSD